MIFDSNIYHFKTNFKIILYFCRYMKLTFRAIKFSMETYKHHNHHIMYHQRFKYNLIEDCSMYMYTFMHKISIKLIIENM